MVQHMIETESGEMMMVDAPPARRGRGKMSGVANPGDPEPATRRKGRGEVEVAKEVIKRLGRPIATIPGAGDTPAKIYTYSVTHGWTEDRWVSSLADLIHGSSGTRIMGIIGRRFQLPISAMTETCYFAWHPRDSEPDPDNAYFLGQWEPIIPSKDLVYFSNGAYNLKDNSFTPYPGIVFGPMITVPYQPEAAFEPFVRAVNRHFLLRPEEQRRFQQECGKMLQPHLPNKYEVYLLSPIRDNGKSTLMNALAQAPGGQSGFSTVSQKRMSTDQFALAALMNKFANVSSDSGHARDWSETLLSLTSGPVSLRFMHREPFSTVLTAKLYNTCNEMQTLNDRSGNMSNRIKVFRLNGAAYERGGEHGEDAALNPAFWASREARAGIVSWMFHGLHDLYYSGPERIDRKEQEEMLNEGDPERGRFLEAVSVTGRSGDFVASSAIVDRLFPGQAITKADEIKLGMIVRKRMFALFSLEPEQKKIDGKAVRGYSGCMLI
jgi:hypothetical protein